MLPDKKHAVGWNSGTMQECKYSKPFCLVSSVFSFGGQSQHDHHLSASQSSYLLCELCTSCQLGMNKKMVLNRQTQLQNNE